ncbi:MAG TPA: hypothetical protein VNW99_04925 [Cytophagaceae bacterium]|jgi:hypothetical protein|nr:hypothetical protein [Cytophagaceae bacterium]
MRSVFIIVLLLASVKSFAQPKKINELTINGSFKLDKGHNGHNTICIIDADKNDTIQVLSYKTDKLLQKGLYSLNFTINRNYSVYFASDGYEDIWKPLKISVSTTLPKNKKSIESQQLNYNVNLSIGQNKESFISYNKIAEKFEVKLK